MKPIKKKYKCKKDLILELEELKRNVYFSVWNEKQILQKIDFYIDNLQMDLYPDEIDNYRIILLEFKNRMEKINHKLEVFESKLNKKKSLLKNFVIK